MGWGLSVAIKVFEDTETTARQCAELVGLENLYAPVILFDNAFTGKAHRCYGNCLAT
jgi:hypothetical protein